MRADRFYPIVLIAWFFVAYALADSGRLAVLEPPAPQLIALALSALLVVNSAVLPGFRRWLTGLDLRRLVAVHLGRFLGVYFLVLYRRGELPYAFAVEGGIGDVAVALGAVALLVVPRLIERRPVLLAWNVVGALDIAFVVATAARLGAVDPTSMRALSRLPLALLSTFLVPLVVATHVWIFARFWSGRAVATPPDLR
jgi:hypothetical protein